jgi:PHP family Zn ribbon phosphoesterase
VKLAYDLHIHSVLSPCANELMTPNNILNMAMLNDLDLISVTDHNSVKQYEALIEIAESYDFVLIPGLEVQVEGAHILCYFRDITAAKSFERFIEDKIIKLNFDAQKFKEQEIANIYDETICCLSYMLLSDLDLTVQDFLDYVSNLDCVVILAHIDRAGSSALPFINEGNLNLIDAVEITKHTDVETFKKDNPIIKDKVVFRNSDCHSIVDLNERVNFLDLEEKSIDGFFKFFGK